VYVVNKVFLNLATCVEKEEACAVAGEWQKRFRTHTTARAEVTGYCYVETGLKRNNEESVTGYRGRHFRWVAEKIVELVSKKPTATVGVLCRKNDAVGRMIYELRLAGVAASEEGGNPVTDSPAVEVVLSLFLLADHPGHSIAEFHLKNCPLTAALIESELDPGRPTAYSRRVREELLATGYGPFVSKWARRLASRCSVSDRLRLDQLVALAHDYQPRATLRAADFVSWVCEQKVAAPTSSRVRVLTLHKAKGLEFDAVVLPELDVSLKGRPSAFIVADADPPDLPHGFVGRRLASSLRPLADSLTIEQSRAADRREIEESLCLLYVALTRAREGMYLFPPGPYEKRKRTDEWDTVVLKALCPNEADTKQRKETTVVFATGNPAWEPDKKEPPTASTSTAEREIRFARSEANRRRVEWLSPSQLEGGRIVSVPRLFDPLSLADRQIGTLYHAWLATIEWLDEAAPTDDELLALSRKLEDWAGRENEVKDHIRRFRVTLRKPALYAVLSRTNYPDALRVESERPFTVRDGNHILNGSIDRLVWSCDADGRMLADVIDFKTDAIPPEALPKRVAYYRPQIEAYRRAVTEMAHVPAENVSANLVFTALDRVERIPLCSD
jgi:ATP-dependent exoDNAse (exonuclease V) beta subunit